MGEMEARYLKESKISRLFGGQTPTICTNVVDTATGKTMGDMPYVIKTTPEGLTIGITSAINENLVHTALQQQVGIQIQPATDALRKYVSELRGKCDLVIVLAHTGMDAAKKLAADVQGIDIILSGHPTVAAAQGDAATQTVGNTVVMQARGSGKYVAKLVLDITEDRTIGKSAGEFVGMADSIKDDPEMAKLIAKHDQDLSDYYGAMRASQPGATVTQVTYTHRDPRPFVSSVKCYECHKAEYESWQKTAHATAFETLRKDRRTSDPECVSCHTTGFKSKGGFTSEGATPQLTGVQCESCHGPGVMHSRRPKKGYGPVTQTSCTECHNPAHSPKFDFEKYHQAVRHK